MISTKCKDCFFSKIEVGVQVGCSLNRHSKLGINTVEDGMFILERFCNAYRPQQWVDNLDFEDSLNPEKTVLQEVRPRIGFFIKLKTDEVDAIEKLQSTLESMRSMEDFTPSYVVVITDKVEYNEEIWTLFIKNFGEDSSVKYHIVQSTVEVQDVFRLIDEAFTHAQNGWIKTMYSGQIVQKDLMKRLHKLLNIDMRQLTLVRNKGEFSMLFPAFLFKFLNGNRAKVFSDEVVDTNSFVEKIENAEQRGGTNTIMEWDEFYAS